MKTSGHSPIALALLKPAAISQDRNLHQRQLITSPTSCLWRVYRDFIQLSIGISRFVSFLCQFSILLILQLIFFLTFESCIHLGLCHIILYVRWTSTSRRWSIGMAFLNCKLSTDYSNEFANTVNQRVNLTSFLRRSPGTQLTFTKKTKINAHSKGVYLQLC